MEFLKTKLKDLYIINPSKIGDERGFFSRLLCKKELDEVSLNSDWVNINNSLSFQVGTLRGMHFQLSPKEEIKIIRCINGAIFDVVVDLRKDSLTFKKWYGIELTASNRRMLYIPKGFAHGFITLEKNTEIIYFSSQFYSPTHERVLLWNDPSINIQWPISPTQISSKDKFGLSLDLILKEIYPSK